METAAISAWIEALESDDRREREAARIALVEEGSAAVPPLIRCLGDERVRVRWEAAKALVDLADPAAAPKLVERSTRVSRT